MHFPVFFIILSFEFIAACVLCDGLGRAYDLARGKNPSIQLFSSII